MTDEEIRLAAIKFARRNKDAIARELTDTEKYLPDNIPISVFMAGSPGAGKTEFSKNLISILEKDPNRHVIRIDADEIRPRMPDYTGHNSHLFQGAVSIVTDRIHDFVLKKKQSFIFDSTFAKYDKAIANINRSLEHGRPVDIFYLYQKPHVAWKFTEAREKTEGRNIPKSAFIEEFFGAQDTVNRIWQKFQQKVTIFLVKKDFEKNIVEEILELKSGDGVVDDYIKEHYTKDELEKIL